MSVLLHSLTFDHLRHTRTAANGISRNSIITLSTSVMFQELILRLNSERRYLSLNSPEV